MLLVVTIAKPLQLVLLPEPATRARDVQKTVQCPDHHVFPIWKFKPIPSVPCSHLSLYIYYMVTIKMVKLSHQILFTICFISHLGKNLIGSCLKKLFGLKRPCCRCNCMFWKTCISVLFCNLTCGSEVLLSVFQLKSL